MHPTTHYEHFARLFEYPGADYPAWVRATLAVLAGRYPAAEESMAAFAARFAGGADRLPAAELDVLQELFTRSFDVQAITTLSVGYLVFGDDYRRGELLVHLGQELKGVGVNRGSELPDHLPVVLRLLARWEDRALATEFTTAILYPAVQRMLGEFAPGRAAHRDRLYQRHFRTLIAGSDRAGMFREPLVALSAALAQDFDLASWQPPEHANDFLGALGRELELETEDGAPAGRGGKP